MLGRTNTGGGGGLNFSVVGGTTAPSNPKVNTIWINTSTKITSYVFSATKPTGSAGMVWISTGTSSTVEYNALKKNRIQVYPLSAKQYVSGVWVEKTAKSYQGGEWVDWYDGELYAYGNEYTDVTGGWGTYAHRHSAAAASATLAPTVSKLNDGSMKITYWDTPATDGAGGGVVRTKNKVDLSQYSSLEFTGYLYTTSELNYVRLLIWSEMGTYQETNLVVQVTGSRSKEIKTYEPIDVSALSGKYYIGFGIYMNDPGAEVLVQKLKLNK